MAKIRLTLPSVSKNVAQRVLSLHFLINLNTLLAYSLATALLGILLKRNELCINRDQCINVHGSIILDSQKLETILLLSYTYNGPSNKNE